MRKWALTLCAEASPNVTGPEAALNPFPHNRALRQNQDSRSSVVRPLRRHSKSRPTHHRSGKDRKLSNATLGEKSTQPSPCEATRQGERARRPAPHELRETRTSWCAQDEDRITAAKPAVSLRSKSARTIRSGSLRSRQHIRNPEPLRSPRTGLRLLNTNQVRRPARHARRGGIAPRRPDRETHRNRAARGKATRSESDRRVPASGGAKKIRYAISAPQERLHPVAILFAPRKAPARQARLPMPRACV